MSLLQIQNLKVQFKTDNGLLKAVDDISFEVQKGKTLCIVGESGCGKSVTAMSILGLIQTPPGNIAGGKILFEDRDLLKLSEPELRKVRGNEIAMIFQDPMTSLNPVFTCGSQISEALVLHRGLNKKEAHEKSIDMLRQVKIPDPEKRVNEYPHQLSGGMRQRVMIAMALSCSPKVLIADEPTTALDVTIQAQILELLAELKETQEMTVVFITHDLGVVAEIADDVLVLYAGKVAERGSAKDIFENSAHPYTKGLLASVPVMTGNTERLHTIPGNLPDPTQIPEGCRFYDRCDKRTDTCKTEPVEKEIQAGHAAACFHT